MKKKAFLSMIKHISYALLLTASAAVLLCFPAAMLIHKSIVPWENAVYLLPPVWCVSSFLGAVTLKPSGAKAILPFCTVIVLSRLLVSLIAENGMDSTLVLSEISIMLGCGLPLSRIKRRKRRRAK